MQKPLVSIIVPIYQVEKYLMRCVESLINQTYENIEIILVDDGSSDGSERICDHYKTEDSRVKVVHKQNGGLSDARNAGLDLAKGEYIFLVDSDDWINLDAIEVLVNLALEKNSDLVICDFIYAGDKKEVTEEKYDIKQVIDTARKIDNIEAQKVYFDNPEKRLKYTVAWNKLYKAHLFDGIRYPKGLIHEDEFTTFKLLYNATNIYETDCVLNYYFVGRDSIMTVFKPSRFDLFEAYLERIKCYSNWQYFDLAASTYMLAIHMLCQYKAWISDQDKNMDYIIQEYYNKLRKAYSQYGLSLNSKSKIENKIFTANFKLYYFIWKRIR